jgi:hypothetical protein
MNTTQAEAMQAVKEITSAILGYEEEIQGLSKDLAAAAKKGDMSRVKRINRSITKLFELITQMEGYKANHEEAAAAAEKEEQGHGPIMEFLNDLYEQDVKWHAELKADYKEKGYKHYIQLVSKKQITKTVFDFARMTEKDAKDLFKRDINIRYMRLVHKVSEKVGEIQSINVRRNTNQQFDGLVTGTKGQAQLTTVLAGGENIQRLHYRTLVKVVK